MKPSERIKEIAYAKRMLKGINPEEPLYTFEEDAIVQYLDEEYSKSKEKP